MLTLKDLLIGLGGELSAGLTVPDATFGDVVVDSRLAGPGSIFVALQGEHQDGHDFIADALSRGATAIIAEERARHQDLPVTLLDLRTPLPADTPMSLPACCIVDDSLAGLQRLSAYWRARMPVQVVGITGSVGKTTTKELTHSVLRQRFRTIKSLGNYNNEIGVPLTLLTLRPEHERAVIEMGMYAIGEIALLAKLARPRIGVVTNVGPSHLERLGTLERIAQAKAELVEALPADGFAILNGDDPLVRQMAERTQAQTFFYGLTPDCDLWAEKVESRGLQGIAFWLHYRGDRLHVSVPLLGRHSVHTALRATAVGLVERLTWQEILDGLRSLSAQLRLVVVQGMQGSTLLDDTYNSSPDSCLAALNLLAEMDGRRIAVLGGMLELGAYEEEGHRKVGARAAETCHVLVTVGSLADLIREEALAAGMPADAVHRVEDNQEAIELLRSILAPGDFVLLKGSRAFQMEEIVSALSASATGPGAGASGSQGVPPAAKSQTDSSSGQEKPA